MQVFQIRIKIFLLQDIPVNQIQTRLTALIDKGFCLDKELSRIHEGSFLFVDERDRYCHGGSKPHKFVLVHRKISF